MKKKLPPPPTSPVVNHGYTTCTANLKLRGGDKKIFT